MFRKVSTRLKNFALTLRQKLILSLSSIAVVLMVSSTISVLEYSRMSDYVSALISENINSINLARKLSDIISGYNLEILTVIGNEAVTKVPDFDQHAFLDRCDSLEKALAVMHKQPLADSVVYAYSAYMLTSLELPEVLKSDFIDSRSWYFDRLQPSYNKLNGYVNTMISTIYADLKANSLRFDRGFYRSVIPGIVAVIVGLLLIFMLLFFVMSYYVNPLVRMLRSLDNYRSSGVSYNVDFDGDDELKELNEGIRQITQENQQLSKRIKDMRERFSKNTPGEK
ncbi:MAG: hypothetical protein IJM41_04205 [Bacteroidales bacterium]|nr:hypothetical protein [Bacteroidales bacterium]